MKNKKNAGSILIVALWILTIFVMLVISLGYRSNLEAKLALREKEYFETEQLLFSGINIARYYITNDEEPTIDSVYDRWYNQIEIHEDVWPSENILVSIVDEESKLNINQASERSLTTLLEYIDEDEGELDTPIDDLVSGILYWRGDSSSQGKGSFGTEMKGEPFTSVDELLLLPDITYDDFVVVKKYVTVHSSAMDILTINVNTVYPAVLKAVIFGLAGDKRHKRDFFDKIIESRPNMDDGISEAVETETSPYFTKDDLSPYQFLERIGMSSDVLSVSLAMQLLRHCTVDSNVFFVNVSVDTEQQKGFRTAQAVLGPARDGAAGAVESKDLKILAWYEE